MYKLIIRMCWTYYGDPSTFSLLECARERITMFQIILVFKLHAHITCNHLALVVYWGLIL